MPDQYEAALIAAVVVLTLLVVSQMGRSGEGFVSPAAQGLAEHAQQTHSQNATYQDYKKGASGVIEPYVTPVSFVKTKQMYQKGQLTPEMVESMVVS